MDAYWRTLCMDTARANSLERETTASREYNYQRCSPSYVDNCRQSWLDVWMEAHMDASIESKAAVANWRDHSLVDTRPKLSASLATSPGKLNFIDIDFAICSATLGRRLFWTDHGYIALPAEEARVGDLIYVFAGAPVPIVIREAHVQQHMQQQTSSSESCVPASPEE